MAGVTSAERLAVAWAFNSVMTSFNLRENSIVVEQKIFNFIWFRMMKPTAHGRAAYFFLTFVLPSPTARGGTAYFFLTFCFALPDGTRTPRLFF